jgi:hypothetical protein
LVENCIKSTVFGRKNENLCHSTVRLDRKTKNLKTQAKNSKLAFFEPPSAAKSVPTWRPEIIVQGKSRFLWFLQCSLCICQCLITTYLLTYMGIFGLGFVTPAVPVDTFWRWQLWCCLLVYGLDKVFTSSFFDKWLSY